MNRKLRARRHIAMDVSIALAIAACLAAPARAIQLNDAFAGQRDDGRFYSINLATGAATQIGGANVLGLNSGETLWDLEFGLDGKLYGLTNSRLLRVDPATGVGAPIGPIGLNISAGFGGDLALDSDGTMFGVVDNRLFTVNLATGAATVRGSSNLQLCSGLVFAPNGSLYVTESISGDDALYRLNKVNGANLGLVGTLGPIGAQGLDVHSNGTVYMIDDFVNQLFILNVNTAAKTLIGSTLTTRLQSLAIYTVPEPSALSALATGALAILALGRRRTTFRN